MELSNYGMAAILRLNATCVCSAKVTVGHKCAVVVH